MCHAGSNFPGKPPKVGLFIFASPKGPANGLLGRVIYVYYTEVAFGNHRQGSGTRDSGQMKDRLLLEIVGSKIIYNGIPFIIFYNIFNIYGNWFTWGFCSPQHFTTEG